MPIFTAYTVWIYCFGSVTMGAFNILTLTCRLGRYSERPSLSFFIETKNVQQIRDWLSLDGCHQSMSVGLVARDAALEYCYSKTAA